MTTAQLWGMCCYNERVTHEETEGWGGVKVMHRGCEKAYKITETTSENKYTATIFIQTYLRMFYG